MTVLARSIAGVLVVFVAQDLARGEDPRPDCGLEIEGKIYKEGTFVSRTLHTLKLAPGQLSSLTFDLEAVAGNKVRLTVNSKEGRPLTFRSWEIPAGRQGWLISAQPSNDRLEVVGDKIYVYYDRPKDWWVLTAAEALGEGRLDAHVRSRVVFAEPRRGDTTHLRAGRITVTVAEAEESLSLTVAPDQ